MKTDKIMWGIILLFVGGVLLLENFQVIDFYWRNVWRFWPVFLIIAGVNILFSRNKSKAGGIISISVLVIVLCFLFYRGQQPPEGYWFGDRFDNRDMDIDLDGTNQANLQPQNFSEPFNGDSLKKVVLNISGNGTSYQLKGETDSLIIADVMKRRGNFMLRKEMTDSAQILTFKMQEKRGRWSIGNGGNDVGIRLNTKPVWDINVKTGAGEVGFDLKDYKIRTFNFDGGAAALDIKMGDLLPVADVMIKTGVADVKIGIPKGTGCRIITKIDLSSKDFTDFTKLENGTYETSNYKSSNKKIFITLNGGLSNFEVNRY